MARQPRITARGGRRLLGTGPSARPGPALPCPARIAARPLAARHGELRKSRAGSRPAALHLGAGGKAGRPLGLLSGPGAAVTPSPQCCVRGVDREITNPTSSKSETRSRHDRAIWSPHATEPVCRGRGSGTARRSWGPLVSDDLNPQSRGVGEFSPLSAADAYGANPPPGKAGVCSPSPQSRARAPWSSWFR